MSACHSGRDFLLWRAAALLGRAISLKNFDLNQSPSKASLQSVMLMPLSVQRRAFEDLCGGTPWERSSCATRKIRTKGKTSPFIDCLCGLNLQTFFFSSHEHVSWMLILNQSVGVRGALRLRADYIKRETEFIVMGHEDSYYFSVFAWIKQIYLCNSFYL